jgi:small basic protein
MSPILKNILAVIAGIVIGSVVNMGIIMVSGTIIPAPNGADVTTMEGLKATLHLFEPKHFIFPFLAHALGTLAGAFLTEKIAANNKLTFALVIGVFFLAGGIANTFLLPSPFWFTVLDLVGAYIPMAYLGAKLASNKKMKN